MIYYLNYFLIMHNWINLLGFITECIGLLIKYMHKKNVFCLHAYMYWCVQCGCSCMHVYFLGTQKSRMIIWFSKVNCFIHITASPHFQELKLVYHKIAHCKHTKFTIALSVLQCFHSIRNKFLRNNFNKIFNPPIMERIIFLYKRFFNSIVLLMAALWNIS